ncbi:50S ribosomal protein L25 [Paenibacillus sp. M1]|uniref:Large ribosomal subunit protein bL25 n=1 Tax=Paenibacillus haidiansis TaxID=1574488 RepID=A0ABU7VNS2_9BACL
MAATHQTLHLDAARREDFTKASLRQLRENGRIPAVIYGAQTESLSVHVDAKELTRVSRTGRSEFFDLKVEGGETFPALIKEIQQRGGNVVHVDFLKVSKNRPIRVRVPLHFSGTAEGTKAGGVLQIQATELEVEGLPDDLPATIEPDVTALGIGDKLTAADVSLPQGVTLIAAGDELLASVVLPQVIEGDTEDGDEEAESAGAADTEAEAKE